MLMSLRDSPETVPTRAPFDTLDVEYDEEKAVAKRVEKSYKQRRLLNRALAGTAIASTLLTPLIQAYYSDVRENRAQATLSTPEINPIESSDAETLLDTESAIFYLAGFDTVDGRVFGERVGIALHQITPGEDLSINYGDAPLDPQEIARKIIEYSKENRLKSISLAGNSLGGIVTLSVALNIIKESYIDIDVIYLNAMPDGSDGLKVESQEGLATMLRWVDRIPDAKYSNYVRYVATMGQESGRFLDGSIVENLEDFISVSNETIDRIQQKRLPGMWLLVDQALALTNGDVKTVLTEIGELRTDKEMPTIAVVRTMNPKDDQVVDVEKSAENTCTYAFDADLNCTISYVEGAHHTSYDFDSEAFTEALSVNSFEISRGIKEEETRYALAHRGMFATLMRVDDE